MRKREMDRRLEVPEELLEVSNALLLRQSLNEDALWGRYYTLMDELKELEQDR